MIKIIDRIYLKPEMPYTDSFCVSELKKDPYNVLYKDEAQGGDVIFPCDFTIWGTEDNDDDLDEYKKIGYIKGYLIEPLEMFEFEKESTYDCFNAISANLEELYHEMNESEEISTIDVLEKIYNIDSLTIENIYRNNGVGSAIFPLLALALNKYLNWNVRFIILKAYPIELLENRVADDSEEFKNMQKRLFRFYKKNGFIHLHQNSEYFTLDIINQEYF